MRDGGQRMRIRFLTAAMFTVASVTFAQSDRGSITGTTVDPTGAAVTNAEVEATNVATGAVYKVETTATGNYTLAELPAGVYQLSVAQPGFKKYVRQGLTVLVSQTLRIDVALAIGETSDPITVQADAASLKTETGELT